MCLGVCLLLSHAPIDRDLLVFSHLEVVFASVLSGQLLFDRRRQLHRLRQVVRLLSSSFCTAFLILVPACS